MIDSLEIFLAAQPGLENLVAEEAKEQGLEVAGTVPGGVTVRGDWPAVWHANLVLRGTSRVLVRIGAFRAMHLAQLDKRARKLPWAELLAPNVPVRIEASTKRSKIYHSGAAAQRVGRAITETVGAPIEAEADLRVVVRIENDLCTVSLDTSGEPLHRRGHKLAVGKAPLRETQAALFLRACGYEGREPVLDPMCGSGTFPIEAAEWAAGLMPGRDRVFAFERLRTFDAEAWHALKDVPPAQGEGLPGFVGYDRDAGAISNATKNAERAGLGDFVTFRQQSVSALTPPEGPAGLVMVNPPYGARIGEGEGLRALYQTLGRVLRERFSGWRVGLVTSESRLAKATGLPFLPPGPPVPHGPLKIRLYRTEELR